MGMVLPVALFYGGLAQFAAGMWEMKRGKTFGTTVFTSFGAFWMALAVMNFFEYNDLYIATPATGMAWFFLAWGIFSIFLTVCAVRASKLLVIVFASLTLFFLLLAVSWFRADYLLEQVAGFTGIIAALLMFYHGAAVLLHESFGRPLLPVGLPRTNKGVKPKKPKK